ncbi:Indoleamine 2,3-dioxygenase [Serendipita vermifera]|nr:Indoleamine 2,3-dioxygenase [Serendipita vermifera]
MEVSPQTFSNLAPQHALARPRNPISVLQSVTNKPKAVSTNGYVPPLDTSTLAAHDFDVDVRSGFMPPEPPIDRLPPEWAAWEEILDDATQSSPRLKPGDYADISAEETERSGRWRDSVQDMPLLSVDRLRKSERHLRRAHLVLAWILHIYVHTQPPSLNPIIIPSVLATPLLAVSKELVLPPVLTYADTVLYNWRYANENSRELKSVTLFTGTRDEEHFFLTSAYIELAGVEALSLMQRCYDEAFVADSIALRRIASYLKKLAGVINRLTVILDAVRDECDPKTFYHEVRPWFRGEDSGKRRWIFLNEDGDEVDFGDHRELSGPSAGQSSLIHALDIFLGVDHTPRRPPGTTENASSTTSIPHHPPSSSSSSSAKPKGFLDRMQAYMPRHHRTFMEHLKASPRPIRQLVSHNSTSRSDGSPSSLANAYNAAVSSLKGLRDAHIRIATLYIINQMPRNVDASGHRPADAATAGTAKGTGGSDLVPFLKGSRDDTTRTLLR